MVNERGPLNAANPIPLAVKATFTSSGTKVDCTVSNCVVFIRRDHEGTVGGVRDLSLDTLIPVSFTAAPVTPAAVVPTEDQTISPFWPAKKYKATVSRKAKKRIARVAMLTTQGNALTYSSQTPKTCAVMISKKYVDIKFTSKGICNVTATAAATDTYKPTEFTWTYKVR